MPCPAACHCPPLQQLTGTLFSNRVACDVHSVFSNFMNVIVRTELMLSGHSDHGLAERARILTRRQPCFLHWQSLLASASPSHKMLIDVMGEEQQLPSARTRL